MSEFKTFQGFIVKDETARNEVENLRGDFEKHTHSKSEIEDFAHTHNRSEIEDFAHTHNKSDIVDFAHSHKKSEITDFAHTHSKSEITDFAHTHSKSEITDFAHTHSKSEITDFAHGHNVSEVSGAVSIINVYENPSISSTFAPQKIEFTKETNDIVLIEYINITSELIKKSLMIQSGSGVMDTMRQISSGSEPVYHYERTLDISNTGVQFGTCCMKLSNTTYPNQNEGCVPFRIFLIKGVQ